MGVMDSSNVYKLFPLAHKKRETSSVTIEYRAKKLKAHLKGADKINARYCVVIGEDEVKNKTVWVKDLEKREEYKLKMDEF